MKIGITERGDAGIDLSWYEKLDSVDGAVLISKNFTEEFKQKVLSSKKPLILHCTCTGFGGTALEPNVPDYITQLNNLKDIIDRGFPAERCVLRIDPIFPSTKGLRRVRQVLTYFYSLNTGVKRIRISVVDEYKHVKERYKQNGWNCLYNGFQANTAQLNAVLNVLNSDRQKYEICAESRLWQLSREMHMSLFNVMGCVSEKDIELMGLECPDDLYINPQNRSGCHCLSCKTELLTNKYQCPHKCVYCYWITKPE